MRFQVFPNLTRVWPSWRLRTTADPFVFVVEIPRRKVQVFPAFLDIVGDQPGCGRDVGVPRPVGLVGVTVDARSLQDRFHRGRSLESFALGRIRTIDGYDLDGEEEDEDSQRNASRVHEWGG